MTTTVPTLGSAADCYARGEHAPFAAHSPAECPAPMPARAHLSFLRAADAYLNAPARPAPAVGDAWHDPAGRLCTVTRAEGPNVTLEHPDGGRDTYPAAECRPLCDGRRVRAATDHGGD